MSLKIVQTHFQVMLLDSSLHLPPPVLMIPSPSHVLLLETGMESPSGEWVGITSVRYYTVQQVPLVLVGSQAVLLPSQLGLGLEQQVLLPSHQH